MFIHCMRRVLPSLLLTIFCAVTGSAMEAPIPLWPNGPPSPRFEPGTEHDATTTKDNLVAGRTVIRLTNVTTPTLTFYPAPQANNSGVTVVVFPGGGYAVLAMDLEGTEICSWLNSIGVNAVLVKYRVPQAPGSARYAAPLQDAQRAMGLVRASAAKWHIDGQRIGVLGFSAGGHLAALLSTSFTTRSYAPADTADGLSCRPDFAILIYPAYLIANDEGKTLAPEFHPVAQTPPTFMVQTEDDTVHVENSLVYYRALKDVKVPAELHLFSEGGHGYGMRPTALPVTAWPMLAEAWLRTRAILR
jgi:acetyl esterase/lipase